MSEIVYRRAVQDYRSIASFDAAAVIGTIANLRRTYLRSTAKGLLVDVANTNGLYLSVWSSAAQAVTTTIYGIPRREDESDNPIAPVLFDGSFTAAGTTTLTHPQTNAAGTWYACQAAVEGGTYAMSLQRVLSTWVADAGLAAILYISEFLGCDEILIHPYGALSGTVLFGLTHVS